MLDFTTPEITYTDKLAPWRDIMAQVLDREGFSYGIRTRGFLVSNAPPVEEYIVPDFFIHAKGTGIILTNGLEATTKDQQRVAMLRGLYPKVKFVALSKKDVNQLAEKTLSLSLFIDTFDTNIE